MIHLLPNAQYELWVTATNTTGISPASEKALYMTGNISPPRRDSSSNSLDHCSIWSWLGSWLCALKLLCSVSDLLHLIMSSFQIKNPDSHNEAQICFLLHLVPCPPVIKQRECTSCPEAALIRWESGNTNPVDSYTIELSEAGTDGGQSGITE